ncbi:MAG: hypothetical protein JSS91_00225 [Bacteroidetes bacterium]|nr:hypothetical protein [Bacteroidota bacterium]
MKFSIFFSFLLISILSFLTGSVLSQSIYSKDYFKKDYLFMKSVNTEGKDTIKNLTGRSKVKKINIGGIFLAPYMGFSIPMGVFGDQSNAGFVYGFKAELAYNKLYPFVFGFIYENQKNPGNPQFTTSNSLTGFETKFTSLGGGVDILLNKFIRSNFTSAIFSAEVKYSKITRVISSNFEIPEGLPGDESILNYSAGLGVTIYIFDITAKYTFAKNLQNLSFNLKFHFPVVKF